MRYAKFVVENYRAIKQPLEVTLGRNHIMPIIGTNEAGKSTILHALFAFDYFNDDFNKSIGHLDGVDNLYEYSPPSPTVEAFIECSAGELNEVVDRINKDNKYDPDAIIYKTMYIDSFDYIQIKRDVKLRKYTIINGPSNISEDFENELITEIISGLPYILFFDEFRDSIDDKIEITKSTDGETGWLSIIEKLFKTADPKYSIYELPDLDERRRKSVLRHVELTLDETLTREWQSYRLDDDTKLGVSVDYESIQVAGTDGTISIRNYITFMIKEDVGKSEQYFFVRNRSKGFFWFFNFVMKLEFNPKTVSSQSGSIYLLDEPGSYLHSVAQRMLCKKLKSISKVNFVFYCTHSHYLLDPEIIPISAINIARKSDSGVISLTTINHFSSESGPSRFAFQPVLEALNILPFDLDMTKNKFVVTEGIIDRYVLSMFDEDLSKAYIPGSNANSIQYIVSLMIGWDKKYVAVLDNDTEGKGTYKSLKEYFFGSIDNNILILNSEAKKFILQNLFDGTDLIYIRQELELGTGDSFEKTIIALYFSERRREILSKLEGKSKANIQSIITQIDEKFEAL